MTSRGSGKSDLTLAVVGCGTMGIAILSGILSSLQQIQASTSLDPPTKSEETPSRLPSKFIASVRRPESAEKIKKALSVYNNSVEISQNDNVLACKQADVVLLGCKPYMAEGILAEEGMVEALEGKLLISILAGVPAEQIYGYLYGKTPSDPEKEELCQVVRAMPNIASGIRESMTVIATSTPSLSPATSSLVHWIFQRIGKVVQLPAATMDAGTALCGSGPAFFALVLEAAIDGAVAMGLPRAEARLMAAQTMKGAAGLVLSGEHPALLKDKVTTPGGCTIGGLLVLEEGGVRGTVSRAIREATVVVSQLGKGVQGVNGTRF